MNIKNNDSIKYEFGVHDKEKSGRSIKANDDLDKDAFLHLLTTQMANQDPLDPMDDREFIAQLAQFSSLEQMSNLNVKATDMIDAIDSLNLNGIEANIALLTEITKIKDGLSKYLGIDLDKIEDKVEDKNTENTEKNEVTDGDDDEKAAALAQTMMAYRLRK